jgi:DNA-binding transcriptional ArsR family regulator
MIRSGPVAGTGVLAVGFLRETGAVERRKVGRIVYSRLVDDHLRDLILGAAPHVAEAR